MMRSVARTGFLATMLLVHAFIGFSPDHARAQTSASATLTGRVSSQEEGPMEGVPVSAKREGSTITITVVSDAQGRYSFPRTRLEPGRYAVRIRAIGYELKDPSPVEVTAQKTTQFDLKLSKTQDLAAQLTNAEWFMSMPGTVEQKMVLSECISCHTLERVVRSRFTASELEKFIPQMLNMYSGGSTSHHIQKKIRPGRTVVDVMATSQNPHTAFLSSINLSNAPKWEYPLKTLPRPTGKGTRVIITEYDLPRPDAAPHDAVVDADGMVWYTDLGQQYIGMLDPKTARVVEYPVPQIKPGWDIGLNNLEIDRDGSVWIALFNQAGLARFDPKTQKFQTWGLPKDLDSDTRRVPFVAPQSRDVDGKIWLGGGRGVWGRQRAGLLRVDVQSERWESINESRDIPKDSPAATLPHGIYGISADSKNNLYELDYDGGYIVKVDAKTLKATFYQTPTPGSAPRRGHVDSKDRLWFAEHHANKVAVFDAKTERFQEWALPTPFSHPYDVIMDKNEEVWTGGMASDRVARLNTKTGAMTEYLLPRSTVIYRVDVDNSTNPITFWVGNKDGASIIRLEPLE